MRKVLALVLAALMVCTVAFAASDIVPGKKIKFSRDSGNVAKINTPDTWGDGEITITSDNTKVYKDVNSSNYSVTGIKYNEGKSYIESIKFDDAEDELVFKMKQDYSNTKEKTFDVEFTLKGKGKVTLDATTADDYNDTFNPTTDKESGDKVSTPDVKFRVKGTVGYVLAEIPLTGTDDEVDLDAVNLGTSVVKFKKADGGSAYAPLNTDYEDGALTLDVRVYDGNKMYLDVNTDAITSVLKANADSDAEMNFYSFDGEPTFDATAKLYFNDADEDHYVYQVKDGKLVKAGSYSEDDGCWVVKARTLGAYVVSDKKLANASTTETPADENPDTGANDVVGIATALAAVALVSAAAVSLKK